ncbi:MAG: flagellar export chaperone FliS [Thermoleophilia bacterium]
MTAYATSSHASYRQSAVLTATPEQLVIMLFDGCHRFLLQAVAAMREGTPAEAGERVGRATAIIDELQCTLDMSAGEVAGRLAGIYVFCRRHLAEGLCGRDTEKVEQVDLLLSQLREAFAEAASCVGTAVASPAA